MKIDQFIAVLTQNPRTISFSQTMAVIEANYNFSPTAFRNGNLENAAGENNGSCKIFSFGKLHDLPEELTLACFGSYYFEDVLQDPEGEGHHNIRNFMKSGWAGVAFKGAALQKKENR